MNPKEKAPGLGQKFADKSSLAQKAGRSALLQIGGGGWQTIVRLGASTILARQLDPYDFGLFGMALLVSELIMVLTNLGMGTGIVAKKDVNEKDLNTCFWTMVGVRAVMFLLIEACAPLAALYFNDPRVLNVVRVVGVNFLFSIPSVVANALLIKELRFKALVLVRCLSVLLESLFAVFLVLVTDLRYWSLVLSMLVASLLAESTIFFISGWRPRFMFDKESFRYLFRYGINGIGFSITSYLHQNIDYLIVGRMLGTASLGLYEFAYKIPHLVLDRISRPVGGVVFPTLSKVQDDDKKLIGGFIKAVKYVTLLVYPILGGLAVVAEPLVHLMWGEKWLPIVVPMQILCLRAAIYCSIQPVGSIFLCKDRPDIPFKFSLVTVWFTVATVGIGGYYFGIIGIAVGMVVSTLPYGYILYLAFKMTRSSILSFCKALFPATTATLICMFWSYGAINSMEGVIHYPLLTIAFALLAGMFGYVATFFCFFKKDKNEIIKMIHALQN